MKFLRSINHFELVKLATTKKYGLSRDYAFQSQSIYEIARDDMENIEF